MDTTDARITLNTLQLDALLLAFTKSAPILATLTRARTDTLASGAEALAMPHQLKADARDAQTACLHALAMLSEAIRPHVSGFLADLIHEAVDDALKHHRH